MEKEFKEIKEMLSELIDMQQSHIDAFDSCSDTDIDHQSTQRQDAFAYFKHNMSNFINHCNQMDDMEMAQSMLMPIRDSVDILYEQNRKLVEKITQRKTHIKDSLKQLSKGKTAMGGYASPAVTKNKPRVISLTN